MKKINFIISNCSKRKVSMLSDLFENISYKFHDKKVKFEVFSDKFKEDIYLLKNIFKKVNLNIEEVPKKKLG